MTEYVAGFMFNESAGTVALVKKERPIWQCGRLNAIGGHIEDGETASQAMVREFQEETGLFTSAVDWQEFCTLRGTSFTVHFFKAMDWPLTNLKTMTDEEIVVIPTSEITPFNAIPNLQWLIPMAKNMIYDSAVRFEIFEVSPGGD